MEHRPRYRIPVSLALALLLSWAAAPAWSQDEPAGETDSEIVQPAPEEAEAPTASVPLGFGGLRVVVDPQTGRVVSDPPPGGMPMDLVIQPDLLRGMRTSDENLVQKQAPGGGVVVNLEGRFLSVLVASVQPDGSVRMDHATLASESEGAPQNDEDTPETREEGEEVDHESP